VKRLFALAIGGLGLRALLRRRRQPFATRYEQTRSFEPSPADELREKLAESRAVEAEQAATAPEDDVAERRRDVHEGARNSIDELS
jgi:hypothetical protein